MKQKIYLAYMMASRSRTIYTGVTNSLRRSVAEHKSGAIEGFTKKYRIHRLVHLETFFDVQNAIRREKEIKGWDRARRVALIAAENPIWEDLASDWHLRHRFSPESAAAAAREQQVPRGLTPTRDDKL